MIAIIRRDLIDMKIPVKSLLVKDTGYIEGIELYESWQPDCLDSEEYNTILIAKDGRVFLAHSIDLDFFEPE